MLSAFTADYNTKRLAIGSPNHLSRFGTDGHPVDDLASLVWLVKHVDLRHGSTPNYGEGGPEHRTRNLALAVKQHYHCKAFPKSTREVSGAHSDAFYPRPSCNLAGILSDTFPPLCAFRYQSKASLWVVISKNLPNLSVSLHFWFCSSRLVLVYFDLVSLAYLECGF